MRKTIWRIADFRNLWLAHSVSLFGTQITLLAFPLAALLLLHASPLEVGLLAAAEFLPVLLLGLPAGAWVDRLPRRPVLIVTDLVRATALAAVPAAYLLDVLSMPLLYAIAFVIGLGTLFFDVAQLSYLPALIDEDRLVDGNAKLEVSRSVAQLAGPTAGGFLVQLFTAPVAIAIDVVSYLVSTVFLLLVKGREGDAEPIERTGLRQEVGEGLRFVFRHPLLRPLVLCAAAADLAFAAVLALQVVYAVDVLELGPGATGVVLAVGNIGGLLAAFVSGWVATRVRPGIAILASVALFAAGAVLLPLAQGAIGFAVGLFVVYLGVVIFNILHVSLCQTVTPSRLLGRMNATTRFITWGMVPLGAAGGGLLVGPVGLRGVFWIAAAICVVSLLPPLFSPVRTLRADPPAADGDGPTGVSGPDDTNGSPEGNDARDGAAADPDARAAATAARV